MTVYRCKAEDLVSTTMSFIKLGDEVLDLNCDHGPQTLLTPRLHICTVQTAEGVHTLQHRPWGSVKPVVFQAAEQTILAVMPESSVDSLFVSLHFNSLGEHMSSLGNRLADWQRVARQQIVVCGFDSAPVAQLLDMGFTLILSDEDELRTGPDTTEHRVRFYAVKDVPKQDRCDLNVKLAIVSSVFPPNNAGQAIVLERLFGPVNPADYVLISSDDFSASRFPRALLPNTNDALGGKFVQLPPFPGRLQVLSAPQAGAKTMGRFLRSVYVRARHIAHIVRQESCGAILGCSGDLVDLPAAFLASRLCSVPFFAYMFDYYGYQSIVPAQQRLTKWAERRVIKGAKQVIVPNEYLAAEYHTRYDVDSLVIHNPLPTEGPPHEHRWPMHSDQVNIVYTGQIYEAQYDALRNLVEALIMLGDSGIKLHLYTAQPTDRIRSHGIDGPVIFHPHQPQARIRDVQSQADILFLPLAFSSPYPRIIATSAPSKLGEYLASGRPVLAHAPADSFLSWYFREHECGLIVDEPNPITLITAIKRIETDADLVRKITANAWQRAQVDFDLAVARRKLYEALGH